MILRCRYIYLCRFICRQSIRLRIIDHLAIWKYHYRVWDRLLGHLHISFHLAMRMNQNHLFCCFSIILWSFGHLTSCSDLHLRLCQGWILLRIRFHRPIEVYLFRVIILSNILRCRYLHLYWLCVPNHVSFLHTTNHHTLIRLHIFTHLCHLSYHQAILPHIDFHRHQLNTLAIIFNFYLSHFLYSNQNQAVSLATLILSDYFYAKKISLNSDPQMDHFHFFDQFSISQILEYGLSFLHLFGNSR